MSSKEQLSPKNLSEKGSGRSLAAPAGGARSFGPSTGLRTGVAQDRSGDRPQRSERGIIKADERPRETPPPGNGRLRGRIPVQLVSNAVTYATPPAEILAEAEEKAAEMLAEAQQNVEALLAQAEAEGEALRDQARQEGWSEGHQTGYEAGHAEGLAAARDELSEHVQTVYQLADEAASAKAATIAGAEDEIVELVIEVARKVIGEMVELNPTAVVNLVSSAIKHANTGDVLTIRVNPRDVELLREHWAEALGDNPGGRRWEIMADRRVKPGGCVIDTQAGSVDARIDTQLVQIKSAFKPNTESESVGRKT